MTIKVVFIDSEHHSHHLARRLLGFFVILFKRVFQMAEVALHSQRGRNELHRRNELVGGNSFQHLDVLVNLLGGLASPSSGRRFRGLSTRRSRTNLQNYPSYTCA